MIVECGFFVKVEEVKYIGPYEDLKTARNNARSIGPNQKIYHGTLKKNKDIVDDSLLFIIPKCQE